MQNLTAFLTAFDPLALLFIAGVVAFVVLGGIAVMRDDIPEVDQELAERSGEVDPPAAEPVRPAPTDGPEHGGSGGRRRRRAA